MKSQQKFSMKTQKNTTLRNNFDLENIELKKEPLGSFFMLNFKQIILT
jgi:hypothetical protein